MTIGINVEECEDITFIDCEARGFETGFNVVRSRKIQFKDTKASASRSRAEKQSSSKLSALNASASVIAIGAGLKSLWPF